MLVTSSVANEIIVQIRSQLSDETVHIMRNYSVDVLQLN